MPRLIWSRPALLDVQRVHAFLAAKDIDLQYRELLIDFGNSGFIVLYRFDGQTALIVAVRHQKEINSDGSNKLEPSA